MNAQIIFLTLFLGIVSGSHPVTLQVSGPIKTVRLLLAGREMAVLTQPPWKATVDLGRELVPRELTAVGLNADGEEIARATQIINLPRPIAEFDIVLERHGDAPPTGVELRWRHLIHLRPKEAKLALDGKPLALDGNLRAGLPEIDLRTPHVLAAEIVFQDNFLARRELVIESVRSDSVGTQLTPIAVRQTSEQHRPSWEGCLVNRGGRAVRTAAVENPRALVIVVREPNQGFLRHALDITGRMPAAQNEALRHYLPLDDGTVQRMIWPVAERFDDPEEDAALLFQPSPDYDAASTGFLRFLTIPGPPRPKVDELPPLRLADAVAVAGIRAMTGAQRRAVVYILAHQPDVSIHDASAVRRYLAALGVPLFVWSVGGPRPDLAEAWGEVQDVSSINKLGDAVALLRRTLKQQRIAWVDVDPLTALRLEAKSDCGIETLARANP